MQAMTFEARAKHADLHPKPEDLAALQALVEDLDRAANTVRGPRPYAEEPLSAFHLPRG
jgi:hypothetical protein